MTDMTPKKRMLNAYMGLPVDHTPVAPEFWYYYPAKVLGVSMIEFERELPFWKSLKTTFEKYDCDGWGIAFPKVHNEYLDTRVTLAGYEEKTDYHYKNHFFSSGKMYDKEEPSWVTKHLADEKSLADAVDMLLDLTNEFEYEEVQKAHQNVGESFLLELWCGVPFFDFIAETMGFENAVLYFADEEEEVLDGYLQRYIEYQRRFIRKMAKNTSFESFMIGCSYSCNSLIGQNMWRRWDKPYLQAICEEIHQQERLLHIHFHGRSIETVRDFAEIGLDCVCPFEKPPGGDIDGLEGLKEVRRLLNEKVTMNGNVHTIETLIRGTAEDVRREVRMIKEAFEGSNRCIIGTGDQVGRETPDENIRAMIEEARRIVTV